MPIDLQRILEAAAKAAVEQSAQPARPSLKPKKRRLSTGRAMLLGAGLATAGRLVVSHKGRDVLGRVQERIADSTWLGDREPDDAADLEEYEPEPEVYGDENLPADDEEVIEDLPDSDWDPDADPDEDDAEHEEANADDDGSQESEPKRPSRRRTRQRARSSAREP